MAAYDLPAVVTILVGTLRMRMPSDHVRRLLAILLDLFEAAAKGHVA